MSQDMHQDILLDNQIADLYELSPMQQGMLFHTLYTPGLYIEQRTCRLQGNLDRAAFKLSWQQAINRHSILRTGFYWQELEKPLQVVLQSATLNWTEQDWQALTASEQSAQLEAFLQADRLQEFDLDQPPLMRCALFQFEPDAYQFVWTHHHLLLDGWCNAILLQEVIACYEATCQQRQWLVAPPLPYRSYIQWLQQQDQAAAEQFWRQNLQGVTSPTSFVCSSSFVKSSDQPYEQRLQLSSAFTTRLQNFCQQHRLTFSSLIQAAWAVLLSYYSQETDVVFGVTVSGRPPDLSGIESMLGLFINTLPVRVQVIDELILPWLRQIQTQQQQRECYAYSSLIEIQAWSDLPRGVPLFDSLVVFENYPISTESALQGQHSLTISQSQGFAQTNYPLTLSVVPSAELQLQISYIQTFTADWIYRLLQHLQLVLEQLTTCSRLSEISLLTVAEQQQLLTWNQNNRFFPILCVQQQFEIQVEQTPETIAVVGLEESLTYRELNVKANQLAHYLRQKGIQSGMRVGICLERSPLLIISLLACLKVGAVYLPLDPSYPAECLAFMQTDAQVSIVLTDTVMQEIASLVAQQPETNLNVLIAPIDLAYIIYTSGSTGYPKGVLVPHRALANYAFAAIEQFALTAGDRVLQFASISFDTAAEEIYPTLMSGATLVLRSEDISVAAFLENCQQQNIGVLDLPTAYWHQLVEQVIAENLPLPDRLRLLIIGGEMANPDCLNKWQQYIRKHSHKSIRFINTYGTTETTIVATWWEAADTEKYQSTSAVPIGKPIPNVAIYVLDNQLKLLPIGIPGELYISGIGVSQGYLNYPDLNVERFIPNPFSANQTTLYKTGDRVRHRPDGNLEFLGRYDRQIKLRGFRIEPGEIEAALRQHPAIQEAVVLLQGKSPDQKLIAYLAPESPTDIRAFLSRLLPPQMIPAAFVALEALPLTHSGKIDRRALPAPLLQPQRTAARTPVEELLVGIWSTVLGVEADIHDNFFELGGHSLLATRVISQVRQVFNVEVPLRDLFEYPTIAEFATELLTATAKTVAPILPIARSQTLPLSFAQQRLWFLAQLEPDNPSYVIPVAVRLVGALNIPALRQSFNAVVQRHESLRTAILTIDGQPVQAISSTVQLDLPLLDFANLPSTIQQQIVDQMLAQAARQVIPLEQAPLLRVKLLRLKATEHILVLSLHHMIADGWSIGLLVKELTVNYSAFIRGYPTSFTGLSIQYADFAAWQRSQQDTFAYQLNYWQQQLSGVLPLELPTDHPRPAVRSGRGGNYRFTLSAALTASLQQLSQQANCTLFMTLLAGFQILLHRYTGNSDVVVGTAIANRNRTEIENLIGFFINTLALRTDLSKNPTVEEVLHRVREVSLAAYAHQDLPFEQLVDALQLSRSLSDTPLFQVMFVLQNAPLKNLQVEDLQWTPYPTHSGTAKFDLTLTMQETENGLESSFEYNLDLFEEATIQRLVEHLKVLLSAIVDNLEQPISELPLLTKAEQHQIQNWNQTQIDAPLLCIHELFVKQVQQMPDAIALIGGEHQISYAELDRQSNQLAHHLVHLGVTIETPVATGFDRSLAAIISILGVLKAGGVYVPLDLNYPLERIKFILNDAQVKFLITSPDHTFNCPTNINRIELAKTISFSTTNPKISVTADHLAYILYTSGSTGTSKGVCTPHRGVVRLVKNTTYVELQQSNTILQAAPLTFDASTFEIWAALLNGGRLVLLSSQPTLETLAHAIAQHQVTTLWLTAGLFHLMAEQQLASLKPLQQLLAGGDVLSSAHVCQVRQSHPHIRLINGYGPTEGTTFACCHTITDMDMNSSMIPIGKPIANTQVYVLDQYLQPVPIGVPGELHIAGDGLARGYLNRPDLTAAALIPNPFFMKNSIKNSIEKGLLYKTGDRVRYRADGVLEYLGRLDQQVKIRGFRVEPGEVETALVQHPQVQIAVVVAQQEREHKRLVAYLVLAEPIENLAQTLRQFLLATLPDYLIPTSFVLLDQLPLTANGKVDRRALPSPEVSMEMTAVETAISPRNSVEATLSDIWAAVLHRSKVSVTDNFFELGGDSILAIQIVSRATQAGLSLTPKQLFQHQTIAELAAVVQIAAPVSELAEQGAITGDVPLTPIQHWFFEQNFPTPHHFNQAVLLAEPALNPRWLAAALDRLLFHHDALRSRFQSTETGWQQTIVLPDSNLPFTVFDYTALPAANQIQSIERAAAQLQESLNLTTGPLLRVALFQLGYQQPDRLLLILHHLIVDGVSWRILLDDLQTAYTQLKQGQSVQLSPKTTSYQAWAHQLQHYAHSESLIQNADNWLTLTHQQVMPLPMDYSEGSNTIAEMEQIEISLSPAQTETLLIEVPRAYNTQITDVLLTALCLTLWQWTEQKLFLIDLEGHGRENLFSKTDLSRTVGWFTTISPILLTLKSTDMESNLKQIKEQVRNLSSQRINYGILRYLSKYSDIQSKLKKIPASEISFNYLGQLNQTTLQRSSESVGFTQAPTSQRRYLFDITGAITDGQLHLNWSYSREQYHVSTITALTEQFHQILLRLIEHCRSPEAGGYTPSDFALANLDQAQLDAVLATVEFEGELEGGFEDEFGGDV